MPRFFCPDALQRGERHSLPPGPARHVQVLRFQPGDALTLFDGRGGQYAATVHSMGRSDVVVDICEHDPAERELSVAVHLAVGMPANDRMDWLVEKATELGAASIQPLLTARAVLRLSGERAARKQAHWQAIAVAACEQSGRNQVPVLHAVQDIAVWLRTKAAGDASSAPSGIEGERWVLSLDSTARPLSRGNAMGLAAQRPSRAATLLSGPEGGLSPEEHALAIGCGFQPLTLGTRVLRAETAPLAALAVIAALAGDAPGG